VIETISLFCKNIDEYGPNKQIYITDGDDYSHVIIWNTAMPILKNDIPKKNVIGFAYEPLVYLGLTTTFIEYAKQNIHKYFVGDIATLHAPFIE
jgi:hypothetical protein